MSAALAPEELELVIPEKETNLPQVSADIDDVEILQLIHRASQYGVVKNIQETCVKLFKNRAEFANSNPLDAKPVWPFELGHCIGVISYIPGMLRPCQCSTMPFGGMNFRLSSILYGETTTEVID